jgi:hypothetical protein
MPLADFLTISGQETIGPIRRDRARQIRWPMVQ